MGTVTCLRCDGPVKLRGDSYYCAACNYTFPVYVTVEYWKGVKAEMAAGEHKKEEVPEWF